MTGLFVPEKIDVLTRLFDGLGRTKRIPRNDKSPHHFCYGLLYRFGCGGAQPSQIAFLRNGKQNSHKSHHCVRERTISRGRVTARLPQTSISFGTTSMAFRNQKAACDLLPTCCFSLSSTDFSPTSHRRARAALSMLRLSTSCWAADETAMPGAGLSEVTR